MTAFTEELDFYVNYQSMKWWSGSVPADVFDAAEDKRLMEDHKQEVDTLQRKVSELQAEYKLELKKNKDLSEVHGINNNNNSFCIGI